MTGRLMYVLHFVFALTKGSRNPRRVKCSASRKDESGNEQSESPKHAASRPVVPRYLLDLLRPPLNESAVSSTTRVIDNHRHLSSVMDAET